MEGVQKGRTNRLPRNSGCTGPRHDYDRADAGRDRLPSRHAAIAAEREEQDPVEARRRRFLDTATGGERARFHRLSAAEQATELETWDLTGKFLPDEPPVSPPLRRRMGETPTGQSMVAPPALNERRRTPGICEALASCGVFRTRQGWSLAGSNALTAALTVGEIARQLIEPVHRVQMPSRLGGIEPESVAGNLRIFPPEAVERVAAILRDIDRKAARRQGGGHVS